MSRLTYYSPLWLGAMIAAAAGYSALGQLPAMATWLLWVLYVAGCLLVGVQCQLAMIGAQGLFAQVLPVPHGRSIRGGAAMLGGTFLLGWVALSVVTALLWTEKLPVAPAVLAVVSVLCLAGAVITYVWCWPVAVRDFDSRAV